MTGTGRGGGGETSPPQAPDRQDLPSWHNVPPGSPRGSGPGWPGQPCPRGCTQTLAPKRPRTRSHSRTRSRTHPQRWSRAPAPGGGGAGARLWESPGAGGVCVGTRLCGPWSLVPRGRCVEAAEYGLLYDFVRDLPRPPGEARSTPVTGTWPGKSACPDGARPILPTTVSFTVRDRPPGTGPAVGAGGVPPASGRQYTPAPAKPVTTARRAIRAPGRKPPSRGEPPAAGAPGRQGRLTRRRRSPCRGPASSVPAARASRSGGCARA